MRIELTYSPDDGGWYAEVFGVRTGKTLHQTALYPTRQAALDAARVYVNSH